MPNMRTHRFAVHLILPVSIALLLVGESMPANQRTATSASPVSRDLDPKAVADIKSRIRDSGAEVAIAFRTLDGTTEWLHAADQPFHAASTMKIPLMIELFHQQRQGKLKLTDTLLVRNEFHSIVDGTAYTLNPADDSDSELYKGIGQDRTLADLCEMMITVSSNLATNLLIEKLGVEHIRATVHALDADGMNVLRGVEDGKAFDKGLNNTTTAQGLLKLLVAIAEGRAFDAEASARMIEILERQQFNAGIPAGLPPGTPVAHKTGEITRIHHDAAIVFAPRPYVLVVLVRGIAEAESAALIADISRRIYAAVQ